MAGATGVIFYGRFCAIEVNLEVRSISEPVAIAGFTSAFSITIFAFASSVPGASLVFGATAPIPPTPAFSLTFFITALPEK